MDKKETPTVIGVPILTNKIKLTKTSFANQVDFYCNNLCRLIDQESYWFIERIEALKEGNQQRVSYIENLYLKPLNRKIRELAERMARL